MDDGVGGVDGLRDGGGGGRVMRRKEEEGGGAGFGRGSDGADKQLRRRRRADASMDQSDPGLPQPWPAHCSQGTEGRHLRGWTLECGSYTSCFGTCSNSVARPRSSPANHDKSCLGVLSGLPPARLLASSPPLRNPRTWNPRAALSYRPWAEEETTRVGEGEGGRLPRGLHVWRCGCYGLLQEAQGFDDVLCAGGDGRT